MKRIALLLFATSSFNISFAQIKNFEDERDYLFALSALTEQSYTEKYAENANHIYQEKYEGMVRQLFQFDPSSMNLVYYKTPYEEADNGKHTSAIQWLTKYAVPIFEIDTIIGNSVKNTITIKMKDDKATIQTYMLMSGNEYYPAAKENSLIIKSNKLLKIRNLEKRLNWRIAELQNFDKKKKALITYLNKKLQTEVAYQIKDSLNYRNDKKFKVTQEFQLDNSGQWLSVTVERKNINGNPLIEKQMVQLKNVIGVGKDISVLLESKPNCVKKTTEVKNSPTTQRKIETVDNLFFLHLCYEENNEHIGNEIINLIVQLGINATKKAWHD